MAASGSEIQQHGSTEKIVLRIHTEASPVLQELQLGGLFRTLISTRTATAAVVVKNFALAISRAVEPSRKGAVEAECVTLFVVAEDGTTIKELQPSDSPWAELQVHPGSKLLCSTAAYRKNQNSLPKPPAVKKKPFTKMCNGPIFEMPLEVVMDDQGCGYLPWLVEKTIAFLVGVGAGPTGMSSSAPSGGYLDTPGLFRQSASQAEVQEIAEAFDRGEDVILSEMTSDPHIVAGLLSLYIATLPEPLLTFARYRQFLDLRSFTNTQDRIKHARALVDALPEHNYAILEVLCGFLYQISLRSDKNLMTAHNLAAIIGPTVLYCPEDRGQSVLKEIMIIIEVFEFLIINRDQIFGIQTLEGDISSVYDIDRELGVGAFAVVKVVRHKVTGVEYAAKFIDKSQLATEDKKMLEREVDILRRLRHPHIIALKAVCETPKHLILITELARGGELFDRISQQGAHAEQDVIKICRQLVSAIGYLHSMGIAHRDLKPENILLRDKEGFCIKLADFGLGRIIDEGVAMSTMCGTPSYVAPEVLQGEKYTIAVDMWSVGVIAYILLSGRMPFFGKRMQDLAERIITGTYAFPEERWANVSVSAKEFIKSLLQVDPTVRANAKQAYLHPFLRTQSASSTQLRLDALEKRDRRRSSYGTSDPAPPSTVASSSTAPLLSVPPSSSAPGPSAPSSSSSSSSSPHVPTPASSASLPVSAPSTSAAPAAAASAAPLNPHSFSVRSFHKPTWCEECGEFIWGVFRNGHYCKGCKVKVHKDCIDVFSAKVSCGKPPPAKGKKGRR